MSAAVCVLHIIDLVTAIDKTLERSEKEVRGSLWAGLHHDTQKRHEGVFAFDQAELRHWSNRWLSLPHPPQVWNNMTLLPSENSLISSRYFERAILPASTKETLPQTQAKARS